MWVQIPYFCGQEAACWDPGSQWALDRAKQNLIENYFIVGTTEKLGHFVQMLELHIPKIFSVSYKKKTFSIFAILVKIKNLVQIV